MAMAAKEVWAKVDTLLRSRRSKVKLLTVKQLAEWLQISERTIYNYTHKKSKKEFPIKPIRIGKLLRFREDDVIEFIKSK